MGVESSIYSFEGLTKFVTEYINAYDSRTILYKGMTKEEVEVEKSRKENFNNYFSQCAFGDPDAKSFVKLFIKQLISKKYESSEIYLEGYPDGYTVTDENINSFIDIENSESIYERFMVVLYKHMKSEKQNALAILIDKYKLNCLRTDEYGEDTFYISNEDIVKIYEDEKPEINYNLQLDLLVQFIYESYKGFGVIDELLDMDRIDEVSFGVSGLPNDISTKSNNDIKIAKAYDSISIRYKGNPIQLKFLSFGSWDELARVNELIVKYEQSTEFSQKEGRILGFRKNGSRVTAARTPFGECRVAWVRNFHIENVSFQNLVKGYGKPLKGWEQVVRIVRLLMRGCATTAVSGGQGLGKSTALLAMIEYVYAFYTLRIIESVFELGARRRYPGRDIFTMQGTEYIDEAEAYNFSLRTSGDVTFIGETRDDKMIAQIVNTGNRGSKFTVFSFHPNDPDLCPLEMANAMLRLKIYSNLKEALFAVLKTLKCCIQLSKNMNTGDRYYSIYEYMPYSIEISDEYKNLNVNGNTYDSIQSCMDTFYTFFQKLTSEKTYTTKPLIEYDFETEQYLMKNTISDGLYDHLFRNMQSQSDRIELRKIFRPDSFVKYVLHESNLNSNIENIERIIVNNDLYRGDDLYNYSLEMVSKLNE